MIFSKDFPEFCDHRIVAFLTSPSPSRCRCCPGVPAVIIPVAVVPVVGIVIEIVTAAVLKGRNAPAVSALFQCFSALFESHVPLPRNVREKLVLGILPGDAAAEALSEPLLQNGG